MATAHTETPIVRRCVTMPCDIETRRPLHRQAVWHADCPWPATCACPAHQRDGLPQAEQ